MVTYESKHVNTNSCSHRLLWLGLSKIRVCNFARGGSLGLISGTNCTKRIRWKKRKKAKKYFQSDYNTGKQICEANIWQAWLPSCSTHFNSGSPLPTVAFIITLTHKFTLVMWRHRFLVFSSHEIQVTFNGHGVVTDTVIWMGDCVFLNRALWYTHVKRTNKMHTFYINVLIQLYCFWHVSNIQVFILRTTCTCSFMVLLSCIHTSSLVDGRECLSTFFFFFFFFFFFY